MIKLYKTTERHRSLAQRLFMFLLLFFGSLVTFAQSTDYCEAFTNSDMDWITHITTDGAIQNINFEQDSFPLNGYVYDEDMVLEHYAGGQVTFELGMSEEFYALNAWVDVDSDFEFSLEERILDGFSMDLTIAGVFNIDPDIPNGEYRARVRAGFTIFESLEPCGDIEYGNTIDFTIRIVDEPLCPTPNEVTATNITTNSADLNWTAEGEDLEWEIEYGEAGFELGEGTQIVTTDNPYALSELEPATEYAFRVRTICDTDESNWSSVKNFYTRCAATDIPYTIDLSEVDAPAIPTCMYTENLSGGNNWITQDAPGQGFDEMTFVYKWHGSIEADAWLYTQGLNLTADEEYILTYRYGNNSTSHTEALEIAMGTSATASAMTEVLASHLEINDAQPHEEIIVFEVEEDGVYYFGFNALSEANQFNLFLDDISIDISMDTPDFDKNNFVMYPNPASQSVNLTANIPMTQVNVYNVLGQLLIVKDINTNEVQLDISTLKIGNYFVEIHTNETKEVLKLIVK